MNKEHTLIALNQLRNEIHEARQKTEDEHYSYLVGRVMELIQIITEIQIHYRVGIKICKAGVYEYTEMRIRQLAKEFNDYKGGNHKYEDFGGKVK